MEVKPVQNASKPKYPLKYEFKEETLKIKIPKRWAQNAAAKAALGALAVAALAGCAADGKLMPPSSVTKEASPTTPIVDAVFPGEVITPSIMVAPLFLHGEGRGTFDKASVPAFLSEDEALIVINEAAEEYGLEFSSIDWVDFYNVLQPVTDLNQSGIDGENSTPADAFITLKADFSDSEHGIVIEFISKEDVIAWSLGRSMSEAEIYDTKDAAAQLSESLENASANGAYTAAVLYTRASSRRTRLRRERSRKKSSKPRQGTSSSGSNHRE